MYSSLCLSWSTPFSLFIRYRPYTIFYWKQSFSSLFSQPTTFRDWVHFKLPLSKCYVWVHIAKFAYAILYYWCVSLKMINNWYCWPWISYSGACGFYTYSSDRITNHLVIPVDMIIVKKVCIISMHVIIILVNIP